MEDSNLSPIQSISSSQLTNDHSICPAIIGKSLRPIKCHLLLTTLVTIVILSSLFNIKTQAANHYSTSDQQLTSEMLEDYGDNVKLFFTKKHSCIRRGAICDLRPEGCCGNALCKCNLWGTNCRCQRMGLFQRWG